MKYARACHTATLLADGRVLIAGGRNYTGDLRSAEIYDPSTERFYLTGSLKEARSSHAAAAVSRSALVLVTGGRSGRRVLANAEIYNVLKGRFDSLKKLNTPREEHTMTLLNRGGYLLVGGNFGEQAKKVELNQLSKVGEIIKIITN